MRLRFLAPAVLGAAAMLAAAPARAIDHNNLDANRPLSFDDAESIAFRERALDLGLRLAWPRHRPLGLGFSAEYLYGFARNSHLDIGFEPSIGGRSDSRSTGFSFGNVSVGAFHNFNREYGSTPALAVRADAFLPSGRGSRGVDFRLRGILSKSVQQYNRLHLNLDLNAASDPRPGERQFNPGLILGYSRPLGYPRKFTRTGVAEFGVQAGPQSGAGPIMTVGVGLRQQVTVRSVFDIGLQSDVAGFNGAPRDRIRFVAGYSTGF